MSDTTETAVPNSVLPTFIYTLTALILYIPANMFPFMTLEIYGNISTSTIWGGILTLYNTGSWPLALIVFLASMLIPLFKLFILFYLCLARSNKNQIEMNKKLYNIVEAIGRWSMLDIFLLAVLVAIMKLGTLARAEPEVGSVLFGLVVIFTMVASAMFDPRMIGRSQDETST